MKRDRREFLKTAALAGAGLTLTSCGGGGTVVAPAGVTGDPGGSSIIISEQFSHTPILRKFISPLPGLGGSGIPIANANKTVIPYVDFYQMAAVQFEQQMHPDLPNPTRLWGYQDLTTRKSAYLGPIVVAQRDRPVILQMQNALPSRALLPVDAKLEGAENGAAANRISMHLHGGYVPWTMDGHPLAWYTPKGKVGATDGSAGSCFLNGVDGKPGVAQYYYPNGQSARLLWYHDHAMGITRLNAYSGLASAYLITDAVMNALTSGNAPLVPSLAHTIPLVLQDKSFRKATDSFGRAGDLWYPSRYESTEKPEGRWDRGTPSEGFENKGLPETPSCVPEFFADTPVINGAAYPYLEVEPRRYRFLMLNGSQARFFNLNLFYEDSLNAGEADLSKLGPAFIQIGNEGGLLPHPVVLNERVRLMPRLPAELEAVDPAGEKNLLMAPAERADVIIDFSDCQPGDRLILYNDAPAPFPGGEERTDFYTGNPDSSTFGGSPSTKPTKGPNTRTLMEIRVVARQGSADAFNFTSTINALDTQLPIAYANSHIPYGEVDLEPDQNVVVKNKTLNEDFDGYGRLIQRVGSSDKLYSDSYGRNFMDAPTEIVNRGETQVWDIYNCTGDTHPMHFHLVNVQVIGRAYFDESEIPNLTFTHSEFSDPDPNERGWKETVRMNPGTVTRVIMKFTIPGVPFPVPNSPRLAKDFGINGAEYVWHCHILEHEEHDMMRPLIVR